MTSFERGFLKRASRVGAYMSSGVLPMERFREHPYTLGAAAMLPYLGFPVGIGTDMYSGYKAKEEDPFAKLKNHGYGSAIGRGAKLGIPGSLLGAVAGGLLSDNRGDTAGILRDSAIGAGIGGGALGLLGGLRGAYDKFVVDHTSDESQEHARKFKSEHPLATAFPFGGDLAGAAFSDKPHGKQEKQAMTNQFATGFVKQAQANGLSPIEAEVLWEKYADVNWPGAAVTTS